MKKILLFIVSLLIGIGLLIWIGKVVGWQEIKDSFLVFTGWFGVIIFLLTLLIILISNWRWQEILKEEGSQVSLKGLFPSYLGGFSVMFLAPILLWGGEIFRSYLLKRNNSISWSKGVASVIIDRVLEWTTNLVIIFFGTLFFLFTIGSPPMKLVIIFGGVFLLFAGGISYFYLKVFKKESLAQIFFKIFNLKKMNPENSVLEIEKEIFNFFQLRKKSLWKSFGISFLRAGIMYFRVLLLIIFLGEKISALPALSILGFTYLAAMIPIPAALGSHEVIQTFAFNSLGLGASTATAFTMIIRGAELILALAGVVILLKLGINLLKNTLFNHSSHNEG